MISKTGKHAVLALAALSRLPKGSRGGAQGIARKIGAPQNYLGKLLRALARAGVLRSQKGQGGGFQLARPAAQTSLFEVVDPIEHLSRWEGCFLGHGRCSGREPCALHARWKVLREAYFRFLRETTVADVAREGGV